MPQTIPYVSPDFDKTAFAIPETRYDFHQPSHIFSGQNTTFMQPDVEDGACYLVAQFNYAGEFEHGTVKIVGGIPSLSIPPNSVLMQGPIINVDVIPPAGNFRINFIFRIMQDHPSLEYDSHLGVWNAHIGIPTWPDHFYRYLFRRTWGPAFAPLNSFIGQVKTIV